MVTLHWQCFDLIGGKELMVLKERMDVKSASAVMNNQISDRTVTAYQLGKTASIRRHGAGTK